MSEVLLNNDDRFTTRYQREILKKTSDAIRENFELDLDTIDSSQKASYGRQILQKVGYSVEALSYIAETGNLHTVLSQPQLFDQFIKLDHNAIARVFIESKDLLGLSGRFDRLPNITDQDIIDTLFASGLTKQIQKQDITFNRDESNIGKCSIIGADKLFTKKGQRYICIVKYGKLDFYSNFVSHHKELLPSNDLSLSAHTTGGWMAIDSENKSIRLFDKSVDFSGKAHPAYHPLITELLHRRYPEHTIVFE